MIASFARLDLTGLASTRWRIFGPVLFVVAVAASPLGFAAMPAAALVVAVSASTPFLNDERGRLDLLYASMPIRRSTVVLGRYLALLVAALLLLLLAVGVELAGSTLRSRSIDPAALGPLAMISVLTIAGSLALQLPAFFAVGFTRGRPALWILLVVAGGGAYVAEGAGLLDRPAPPLLGGAQGAGLAALAAAVLLGASAILSTRLYRRRSF